MNIMPEENEITQGTTNADTEGTMSGTETDTMEGETDTMEDEPETVEAEEIPNGNLMPAVARKRFSQKEQIKVEVTLTSKGPGILLNPMTEGILDELAGVKSKAASEKDLPLEERAYRKVIREGGREDGKIGLPVTYLLAALIYAGRFVKSGKDKISTATTTTLYEFLTMEDAFLPFVNQDEEMIIDKRRGVLNNAGKSVAVAIIRPLFCRWEIKPKIIIETSVMSEEVVKKLFEAAGRKAGLGDFRPMKRGPFGMFEITDWQVLP